MEQNTNYIKPANLYLQFNDYCKECKIFEPIIETMDYTTFDGIRETYHHTLKCNHEIACFSIYEKGKEWAAKWKK